MASLEFEFGLSARVMNDLRATFAAYPEIEQVLIFGSRAKGTFKDGSDIDLAVFAPTMSVARFSELWDRLDALPLVFKLDVLHWHRLENERLREKITTEGKVFYSVEQTARA